MKNSTEVDQEFFVAALQSMPSAADLPGDFSYGDKVYITSGEYAGLSGVYDNDENDESDNGMIIITTTGNVEVDREYVTSFSLMNSLMQKFCEKNESEFYKFLKSQGN